MPFYELKCKKCNKIKEVYVSSFNKLDKNYICDCGHNEHDLIVSTTSFQLKGDGWYKTKND